ncbi:MAG: hypothetical protein SPF96_00940, partial [Prevotella sp.]|nr:hypothetical protein [Prevotella sp.]
FNTQHSTFNIAAFAATIQHSTLNIQHSTLRLLPQSFNTQHSTLNIQHSTFKIIAPAGAIILSYS